MEQKLSTLDYLYMVKKGQIAQGLKLGVFDLDEHIRFKHGQFNIIIGHANVGKTTVALYLMMLYSIKLKLKWWVFSIENSRNNLFRKLIEFYICKPIQLMTDYEIEYAYDFINQHFLIADAEKLYTYKDIIETIRIGHDLEKFDGCLIDPYNALVRDSSLLRSVGSHEYDYQVASEFRLLCKEKNITLYLNCHCVTDALRKVHPSGHEYQGLPMPPNMADVEGGGKWGNRADDAFTFHRYVHHPHDWMVSEIHVRKVKETETGGKPTSFDNPIKMRMVRNNCGFEIGGVNPIPPTEEQNTVLKL